ncbi:MAG: ABC transporter ATP-binding protein [Verrucomicrobia bacterium]|nr:ABC transporter ATP-binding protein [Verrucomicrobiota bacterium]MBS0645672.1 ABC transporter ATP-binding protein [Verrucomicrobiota bacterium]
MPTPLFEVKNLKKFFPIYRGLLNRQIGEVRAVDDVSFVIHEREIVGIVGESGCGKSTTARTAIRLLEPTSGEVYFLGRNFLSLKGKALTLHRQKIQMVFQDPLASLNPRKTILDNIGEALLYHKLIATKQEQIDHVCEILKQVGLPISSLKQYPHQFSGGQQQRISIGRAIAMKPKLIILDEAVSALDLSVQAQILNLLYSLKEKLGLSYLFISHDLSVIRCLCDRILVMYQGKIVEEQPTEKLFTSPQHPYTKQLLNSLPNNLWEQQKPAQRLSKLDKSGYLTNG